MVPYCRNELFVRSEIDCPIQLSGTNRPRNVFGHRCLVARTSSESSERGVAVTNRRLIEHGGGVRVPKRPVNAVLPLLMKSQCCAAWERSPHVSLEYRPGAVSGLCHMLHNRYRMTLLLTQDAGATRALLADAVDTARQAAVAEAGASAVGEHVDVRHEDAVSASHLFEAHVSGYRGWRWAVVVAAVGPDEPVTVSEVMLVPGEDALTAPGWVPWERRVEAGDLGVGDVLPTEYDDERLAPAYLQSDDPAVEEIATEAGLGRRHVMSRQGRAQAAQRWGGGEFGPRSDMARSAPASCGTCGFYLALAGSLRAAFGVCGNEVSPADGHVVHTEYGCGAHSEASVSSGPTVPIAELVYDDSQLETATPAPQRAQPDERTSESASG